MEDLALQYNSRFIVNVLQEHIPEGSETLSRIKSMTTKFKDALVDNNVWNKEKLYLMFMFIYKFGTIKTHVIEYSNQDRRWMILIETHLPNLIKKHLNFELNALELVDNALNLFFII